jgi:hypothetical protein
MEDDAMPSLAPVAQDDVPDQRTHVPDGPDLLGRWRGQTVVINCDAHRIPVISRRRVECLIRAGVIDGGMVPKVGAAPNTLQGGARADRGRTTAAGVTLGLLETDARGTGIVL